DDAKALDYARRAYRLRPDTPWVLIELFSLEAAHGNWREALAVLSHAERKGVLAAEVVRRRRAVALLEQARAADLKGESRAALEFARKAHDADPAFQPATAL